MPTDEEWRRAQQLNDITIALSVLSNENRLNPTDHEAVYREAAKARRNHDDETLTRIHEQYCATVQ